MPMVMRAVRDLVARLPVDPDVEPRVVRPDLPPLGRVALIALGGAGGSLLRAVLDGTGPPHAAFPWVTLIINVTGAGLLAFLLVVLEEAASGSRVVRPLFGTGVLGGYTTFSTFAVESVVLLRAGEIGEATAYVVASCLGALLAAVTAVVLARAGARLVDRPARHRRRSLVSATLGQGGGETIDEDP